MGRTAETNGAVARTLKMWQGVKAAAPNWRRDMHEFRATVDTYVQAREAHELAGEVMARQALANAWELTAPKAIAAAAVALRSSSAYSETEPRGRALKARVLALRSALNASGDLCPGCPDGGAGE